MNRVAVIGGTGLDRLDSLEITQQRQLQTPFGAPSAALVVGELAGIEVIFLARHGTDHSIPPHLVNYRANLWALHQQQVDCVLAVAAVGSISDELSPGCLAVPEQLIDYTYGREHTYSDGTRGQVNHIDFSFPYHEPLRRRLLAAAAAVSVPCIDHGVYGATQGPRLETAQEIRRMQRDGCTMVGMTGMPEAALARELELPYACCAVVANHAAGRSTGVISMQEIERNLLTGMQGFKRLLPAFLAQG